MRSIGNLLAVAVMALVWPMAVLGGPTFTIEPPGGAYGPGDVVTVPVVFTKDTQGLSSVTLDITYDSNALSLDPAINPPGDVSVGGIVPTGWGSFLTGGVADVGLNYVDVQLFQSGSAALITTSGTLMNLQFHVTSPPESGLAPIYFSDLIYQGVTGAGGSDLTGISTFDSGAGGVQVVVPEPSAMALLAVGAVTGAGIWLKRRKRP
jgi:hypothetical protein